MVLLFEIPVAGCMLSRHRRGWDCYFGVGGDPYARRTIEANIFIPENHDVKFEIDFTLRTEATVTRGTISVVLYDIDGVVIQSVLVHSLDGTQNNKLRKLVHAYIPAAVAETICSLKVVVSNYAGDGIVSILDASTYADTGYDGYADIHSVIRAEAIGIAGPFAIL